MVIVLVVVMMMMVVMMMIHWIVVAGLSLGCHWKGKERAPGVVAHSEWKELGPAATASQAGFGCSLLPLRGGSVLRTVGEEGGGERFHYNIDKLDFLLLVPTLLYITNRQYLFILYTTTTDNYRKKLSAWWDSYSLSSEVSQIFFFSDHKARILEVHSMNEWLRDNLGQFGTLP